MYAAVWARCAVPSSSARSCSRLPARKTNPIEPARKQRDGVDEERQSQGDLREWRPEERSGDPADKKAALECTTGACSLIRSDDAKKQRKGRHGEHR